MWKPLKGQDRELPSVKVVYPQSEIKWNRFDTQICLGEYNQDSCSKTGEIIKVGYLSTGYKLVKNDIIIFFVGVPLLAVILTITLICVSLKKRQRENQFQARNEIFEAYIFHEY